MTTPRWTLLEGDVRERLADLETGSVQTCITSPPYWNLRDYGTGSWVGGDSTCEHREGRQTSRIVAASKSIDAGNISRRRECGHCGAERVDQQIGLESTVGEYVANLVSVFSEVWRVLRDDGTLWLNLGDSYASKARGSDAGWETSRLTNPAQQQKVQGASLRSSGERHRGKSDGLKEKDLVGVPWRVAFALQDAGWHLRSDIIWAKPNAMPESVRDRPTRAHEYLFLLTKRPRYYYDGAAIREEWADDRQGRDRATIESVRDRGGRTDGFTKPNGIDPSRNGGRNKRDVWTVSTQPYPGAHFAVFPPKLIEPCVLAGSSDQACGECGAPWERVLEPTGRLIKQQNGGPGTIRAHIEAKGAHGSTSSLNTGYSQERATAGWRPTCAHLDSSRSSVVLDPFAGAGTTAIVSLLHGRRFVGIELNPDYAELARGRIESEVGLFAT